MYNFFLLECLEYSKLVITYEKPPILIIDKEEVMENTCGFRVVPLIVGGELADRREFPHMVRKILNFVKRCLPISIRNNRSSSVVDVTNKLCICCQMWQITNYRIQVFLIFSKNVHISFLKSWLKVKAIVKLMKPHFSIQSLLFLLLGSCRIHHTRWC